MKKNVRRKLLMKIVYVWVALFFLSLMVLVAVIKLHESIDEERDSYKKSIELLHMVSNFQVKADFMSEQARSFVVTSNPLFVANYWRQIDKLDNLHSIVKYMKELQVTKSELRILKQAKKTSDVLRLREVRSLKLLMTAYDVSPKLLHDEVRSYVLTEQDNKLSREGKHQLAQKLLFDEHYMEEKERLNDLLNEFQRQLQARISQEAGEEVKASNLSLTVLTMLIILQVVAIVLVIWLRAISLRSRLRSL